MSQLYWSKLPTQHSEQCVISNLFFKQFIPNSAYDYIIISVIKWHQQIKSTSKIFPLNSTEGTLVAKSISCNVRKVSIVCDQRAPWWQLNNEYTTQTVFYLLISFRHLFIILIGILTITIYLVVCACCFMQTDCWRHTSTISVNYRESPNMFIYVNVASGLDAL